MCFNSYDNLTPILHVYGTVCLKYTMHVHSTHSCTIYIYICALLFHTAFDTSKNICHSLSICYLLKGPLINTVEPLYIKYTIGISESVLYIKVFLYRGYINWKIKNVPLYRVLYREVSFKRNSTIHIILAVYLAHRKKRQYFWHKNKSTTPRYIYTDNLAIAYTVI